MEGRESLEAVEDISVFADSFERVEAKVGEEEEVGTMPFLQSDSYIFKIIEDFI